MHVCTDVPFYSFSSFPEWVKRIGISVKFLLLLLLLLLIRSQRFICTFLHNDRYEERRLDAEYRRERLPPNEDEPVWVKMVSARSLPSSLLLPLRSASGLVKRAGDEANEWRPYSFSSFCVLTANCCWFWGCVYSYIYGNRFTIMLNTKRKKNTPRQW